MAKITTLDTVQKLLKYVTITLPPFVTKNEDSYIRQFLSSILEVFKINIDQLNQMFNNTFISQAEDGDLEKLILDISNVTRKDGETNEEYRNRFYKYVYQYNATTNSIKEIVYDTLGYYPIKLTETGARTAYWGKEDLPIEERVPNTAYYYNDVGQNTAYWGTYQSLEESQNSRYFVGIIHLTERPPQEKLNELCDVIERVRKKGTKIFLQFLDDVDRILEPVVTTVEEDAINFRWGLVPSAFFYEVQIDTDPLFSSPTTYITTNTFYNFSGLSSGVTYYTRVRYENDDGYSDWTTPTETTTPSSIGTPIATEETNVGVSGKLANIFTANWGTASGATSYILTIAEDLSLTVPISNYNQQNLGNLVSKNVVLDLETDAYELISWKLQDNSSSIVSSIGGNLNGTLNGTQNWLSSLISSDTYSLKLNGTTNHIQTTNQNTVLNDFTIRLLLRFESGDKASLSIHTLFSKYNTNLSNPSSAGAIFEVSYDNTTHKLNLVVYDSTDTSASPKYRTLSCNFNPTEETNYLLQFSFKKIDPLNSNLNTIIICINGVSQILTSVDTIPNINNLKVFSTPYYLGASVGVYGTYFYGKFRCERAYFSTRFRTEAEALKDAQNLGLSPQTLYYGVKATNGVNTSPYSNIITVNKPIGYLQKDSYTKMALNLNGDYLDSSTNGNNAIPINSPSFTAPLISSESNSLLLDGVNDVLELPNTISTSRTMTIRALFSYNSFTRVNTYLYSEWYGQELNYNYIAKIIIEYDKANNRFIIWLYDDGYGASPNNVLYVALTTPTISLSISQKVLIQFSWNNVTKVAKFYMNNSEYILTQTNTFIPTPTITTSTLNLNDTISPCKIYWGGMTFPNSLNTASSPNQVLSKLYVDDGIARDLTYHQTDWANILPYL